MATENSGIRIGWAQADITPAEPVLVAGQFHARVSEGVADPITATALVLDGGVDHVVFVSCDLVSISDPLRDRVRELASSLDGLDPSKVVLNGTHTHTAPENRVPGTGGTTAHGPGVDLEVMATVDYVAFAAARIAEAVAEAWNSRASGQVAFGLGHAVVGHNRRWHDTHGTATMYGNTDTPAFSHVEGYEDHGVGVVATYGADGTLTGVAVNVPCPSQVGENGYELSADYWHETRTELRARLGSSLFVLPQCSAAGDQSPHLLYDKAAEKRMLELKGRTEKQEIACRLAGAVTEVLPCIAPTKDGAPLIRHHAETLHLPLARLTADDVRVAREESDALRIEFEAAVREIEEDAQLREQPRWYVRATRAHRRRAWLDGVASRFEQQDNGVGLPAEVHVIRVGDAVFATNRFEYYVDYGIHIKARSPATQTFLVQLAGPGTYVPSPRSQAGGGYGSIPASNPVGPEGGRILAERTVDIINELWDVGRDGR